MFRPLLIFALLAVGAYAQAPLVTDRPDFTESGVVVPLGAVQVEGGLTWAHHGEALVSGPEALVRWAPFRRAEVRFGLPDYVAGPVDGFGDASLGTKLQFGPAGGWDLAAILEASIPIGEDDLSSGRVDPLLVLIAGRAVGPVGLGMQGEVGWTEDGLGRGATLVTGLGLTERLGAFVEAAVFAEPEADAALLLHHGYTFLLAPTLQLDVHGAVGLTEAAPDVLLGAGLSLRR